MLREQIVDVDVAEWGWERGGVDLPTGLFGTLTLRATGRTPYEYALTPEDVIWAARFIKGEAGGKDDPDSRAVMWAMFNKYALYAHKHWPTFAKFLRAYSTTLQPHLVNPSAVERSIQYSREKPQKFKWVQWGTFPYTGKVGKYQGKQIPKGQLQHHLDLQRAGWSELPVTVRSLAERLLKGAVPNPIGLASEFANTLTFLREVVRKAGRDPKSITPQEWRDYTRAYARRQKREWIGDRPGLDQMHKNAFFIDIRSVGLPGDAVRIVPLGNVSARTFADRGLGEAIDFLDTASPGRAAESAETSQLASKLDALRNWKNLLLFKVRDDIRVSLSARKMRIQYAHNESYSNDLNIDLYPVRINTFPTYRGNVMTPATLIKYIRLNINSLLDTSISKFHPYSTSVDAPRWAGDDSVGTVMKIDIRPDNAAVVVSAATPTGWTFTTIDTPETGTHPVSGHRTFFIANRAGVYYFVNKGLDMTSTGIAGLGLPFAGEYGYGQADALWRSLQNKVTEFINSNGGNAKREKRYSERIEWRFVYRRYKDALEQVFGRGAGSPESSPFFDIIN